MCSSCNTADSGLETNRLGNGDPTVLESLAATTTTQSGQSSKESSGSRSVESRFWHESVSRCIPMKRDDLMDMGRAGGERILR